MSLIPAQHGGVHSSISFSSCVTYYSGNGNPGCHYLKNIYLAFQSWSTQKLISEPLFIPVKNKFTNQSRMFVYYSVCLYLKVLKFFINMFLLLRGNAVAFISHPPTSPAMDLLCWAALSSPCSPVILTGWRIYFWTVWKTPLLEMMSLQGTSSRSHGSSGPSKLSTLLCQLHGPHGKCYPKTIFA